MAASRSLLFGVFIIRGMKANKLSSMPIYIAIQFVADRAAVVPTIVVRRNSELDHFWFNI